MSIRTWLNSQHPNFITKSQDIGYLKVRYAFGKYVAVGGQLNPLTGATYPSTNTTVGSPVTAKLCSWSTDGVKWQDSGVGIPAAGTSVVYTNLEWNGTYWVASAGRLINNVSTTSKARSTDALLWTNATDTTTLVNGLVSAPATGRFLFVGSRNGISVLELTWNLDGGDMTTNRLLYANTAVTGPMTAVLNNSVVWMCAGFGNTMTSTGLGAQGSHLNSAWTSRTVPWGSIAGPATNQRWVMGLASDVTQIIALVSDTPISSTGDDFIRATRIYRTLNNGVSWLGPIMLPYDPVIRQGPYYDIIFNGRLWCVIGDGSCLLSKDGIAWTPIQIPAGAWRSVASNGVDFVAVSGTGHRIKMRFDEATVKLNGAARMAQPEEWFSEVIEQGEYVEPAITEESQT